MDSLGRLFTDITNLPFDKVVKDNYIELDLFLDGFLQQLLDGESGWYTYGPTARSRVIHALTNLRKTGSILQ